MLPRSNILELLTLSPERVDLDIPRLVLAPRSDSNGRRMKRSLTSLLQVMTSL